MSRVCILFADMFRSLRSLSIPIKLYENKDDISVNKERTPPDMSPPSAAGNTITIQSNRMVCTLVKTNNPVGIFESDFENQSFNILTTEEM